MPAQCFTLASIEAPSQEVLSPLFRLLFHARDSALCFLLDDSLKLARSMWSIRFRSTLGYCEVLTSSRLLAASGGDPCEARTRTSFVLWPKLEL